jgi:hypothetical protein
MKNRESGTPLDEKQAALEIQRPPGFRRMAFEPAS